MLKLHLLSADGYFTRLALAKKLKDQLRLEAFEEVGLVEIAKNYKIAPTKQFTYTIMTKRFGKIFYYTRTDTIVITKTNTAIKKGYDWICKNLIKREIMTWGNK